MASYTYPAFGAQVGFIRSTKADRSDQAELVIGRHTEVFVRSTRKECSATKSDCSWGIEPYQQLIFDTVRLTIDDEPDINYTKSDAQTGEQIDPNIPLMKAKCCIIRRGRISLTIDGKGNPGWSLGQGLPTVELKAAIGTFEVTPILAELTNAGCTWKLINYTVTDTDRDWERYTAEFQGFIDADANGSSVALPYVTANSIEPPSCDCPTAPCCDSYRVEFSLNGEGYAEKTGTVTKNPKISA